MSIAAAKGPAAPAPHANQQTQHVRNGEANGANGSNRMQDGPLARILSGALTGAAQGKTAAARPQEGPRADGADGADPRARPARDDRMAAEAVETLRDYLGGLPSELKFDYDKEAGRQVFKVVNPVTHEVVKQYPPDEFLRMIKRLKELDRNADKNGMLFDDRS
jgi:uncharacterized FlaG/YvyC family protein